MQQHTWYILLRADILAVNELSLSIYLNRIKYDGHKNIRVCRLSGGRDL